MLQYALSSPVGHMKYTALTVQIVVSTITRITPSVDATQYYDTDA